MKINSSGIGSVMLCGEPREARAWPGGRVLGYGRNAIVWYENKKQKRITLTNVLIFPNIVMAVTAFY